MAGEAVMLTLRGEYDIARGDFLACRRNPPSVAVEIEANLIVLDERGVHLGQRYELRCAAKTVAATVVSAKIGSAFGDAASDANTTLPLNVIARCTLQLSRPTPMDLFADHRRTGGFLLADRASGATWRRA